MMQPKLRFKIIILVEKTIFLSIGSYLKWGDNVAADT